MGGWREWGEEGTKIRQERMNLKCKMRGAMEESGRMMERKERKDAANGYIADSHVL